MEQDHLLCQQIHALKKINIFVFNKNNVFEKKTEKLNFMQCIFNRNMLSDKNNDALP